ncbi:MAG: zinc ribbon domain-containing protein [Thermodesulfovibrionales bacterium]
MPIFEYRCSRCGLDFERLVFGTKTVNCPACGSDEVRKKPSLFGMSGVENPSSSGCGSCSSGSCSSCK